MLKMLGSAEPKYLAATDILVGDMSNVNYEFLLYDRPIILLANSWVKNNFPDIGIKTDLTNLSKAVSRSLSFPDEYQQQRQMWLKRTIERPPGGPSKAIIDIILERAGIVDPIFVFMHGNNSVRKTNIRPLIEEVSNRKIAFATIGKKKQLMGVVKKSDPSSILVAAHFEDLWPDVPGYKVHIDHDLKGLATANLEYAFWDYARHHHFPHINLHITAGIAGDRRTKLVLGPFEDRTCIGGYPKADHFLQCNNLVNKRDVYQELGFSIDKPLVTYAPAGEKSFMKPGGSLSKETLQHFTALAGNEDFHVLLKFKYKQSLIFQAKQVAKKAYPFRRVINDFGRKWAIIRASFDE
ncbi:hypothetical protein C4565_09265 [Candidatus Parcubacteria bacterium]|nr:MAG: hypothetical protein C4565_09265 [Candidatus Parcubacteria bacterium]